MFTEDKVTEIFCMADDFCEFFDAMLAKYTIKEQKKREYHRNGTLSKAEVMVIMILFHNSGYRCLKHFYLEHVCRRLRHLFPEVVSYNRFVEPEKDVALPFTLSPPHSFTLMPHAAFFLRISVFSVWSSLSFIIFHLSFCPAPPFLTSFLLFLFVGLKFFVTLQAIWAHIPTLFYSLVVICNSQWRAVITQYTQEPDCHIQQRPDSLR